MVEGCGRSAFKTDIILVSASVRSWSIGHRIDHTSDAINILVCAVDRAFKICLANQRVAQEVVAASYPRGC